MARQRRAPDPGLFPTQAPAADPARQGWAATLAAGGEDMAARADRMARSQGQLNAVLADQLQRLAGLGRQWADTAGHMGQYGRVSDALRDKARDLGRAQAGLALAYGAVNVGILGWVRSGLAGTTTGERLSWQMTLLSRQISSVFLPAVERWVEGVRSAVGWFGRLDGAGQAAIRQWAGAASVFLGVATILPRLAGGFGGLTRSLIALSAASPFTALAASFGAVLSLTERGRAALSEVGHGLAESLGQIAEAVAGFVGPGLEYLADLLSTTAGRWAVFGTLFVASIPGMVRGITSLVQAFTSLPGAIGLGLGVLAVLVAALSAAGSQWKKTVDEIAQGVRSGRTTLEQAEEQVRVQAAEQAYKRFQPAYEERERFGGRSPFETLAGKPVEELEEEERQRLAQQGLESVRRAFRGRQRRDVTPTAGAPEDPRQTLARVQQAAMRAGKSEDEKQTDLQKGIFDLLREMFAKAGKTASNEGPRVGA